MSRKHRSFLVGLAFVTLGIAGLVFAACGGASGPGVASNGSSTSTTIGGGAANNSGAPQTPQQLTASLRFAECLQKHGLAGFPDPPYAVGELNKMGFTKLVLVKYENGVCHKEALAAGIVWTKAELEQQIAQELKIAQCMRNHGIANFPEPSSQGGVIQSVSQAQSIVNEPGYAAAAKTCGAPPG